MGKLHRPPRHPAKFRYAGKGTVLPLTFDEGGRPYTTANVILSGDQTVPVTLVIDTGGGHTLSLDVGSKPGITLPEGARKTMLGRGGSGEISGYVGRIKGLEFAGVTFTDVPSNFPDASAGTAGIGGRQGNLGSGVLRRFNIVYDYSRKQIVVEPNKFTSEPFGAPMTNNLAANPGQIAPAALQD